MPAGGRWGAAVYWGVDANGDWGWRATGRSDPNVPGAGDDVVIDRPVGGPYTVTVSSGAQAARSVVENHVLSLTGGTLDVGTTALINGTLNIAGGELGAGCDGVALGASKWLISRRGR